MSLDKAILHGKDHRKGWRDARAFDPWCRNHGNDIWYCLHVLQGKLRRARRVAMLRQKEGLTEFYNNET